jgi:hypothetical protein
MITTIIFSYNRALQLDELIKSILKYDIDKQLDLHVLFLYTDSNFYNGYLKIKKQYNKIEWHNEIRHESIFMLPFLPPYWHNYFWWFKYKHNRWIETDFRDKLHLILSGSDNKTVMFLTDDSLFYKDIKINQKIIDKIILNPESISYSLRHGENILNGKFKTLGNCINWTPFYNHENTEWEYPFSVDGHIYNKAFIHKILKKVFYKNPNTLEANVACYAREKNLFSEMYANNCSCLVGFEINRVQQIVKNKSLNIDEKLLNSYFINNYKLHIDFDMDKVNNFRPPIKSISLVKEDESVKLF